MHQDNLDLFLSRFAEDFSFPKGAMEDLVTSMHDAMQRGLAGEECPLKMLPTFVGRPRGTEKGRYLAIDLGGTHVRILLVELDGRRGSRMRGVSRFAIPQEILRGRQRPIRSHRVRCGRIPSGARRPAGRHPRLAFTFSFPFAQTSPASGKLLEWTKGFTASGVVGRDVAVLLEEALGRRGLASIRVAVLTNDTVGTLAAGAYGNPICDLGVILGTGTNACYPEKNGRIARHPELAVGGETIVNMEWGGFDGFEATPYDEAIDLASANPGRQLLEKRVSGMYLGEIARRVLVAAADQKGLFSGHLPGPLAIAQSLSTEDLSRIARGAAVQAIPALSTASSRDGQAIRDIGRIVATRAARIAAAAMAAVILWLDPPLQRDHLIAVDGTLFEKYPGFRETIRAAHRELFGDRAGRVRMALVKDGSGIGSAILGAAVSESNACLCHRPLTAEVSDRLDR
jgi:hexokinase